MMNQSRVQSRESRACEGRPVALPSTLGPRPSTGFTLVEMLVTLALLSLIVLALMTVFNSTQKAFRASLTQTDILESGRLAMGLIASDLEAMTPSSNPVNTNLPNFLYAWDTNENHNFNFYANTNSGYAPLIQSLTASSAQRTNLLESFFSLSRQNIGGSPTWVGTGYYVAATGRHRTRTTSMPSTVFT